jgi:Zn finger protein HypA/HybF involved in hydrogenase expression
VQVMEEAIEELKREKEVTEQEEALRTCYKCGKVVENEDDIIWCPSCAGHDTWGK